VHIVVVGVNHASSAHEIRERLTFAPGELDVALAELKAAAREGFILSTCQRVEVYGVVGHAMSGADMLLRFLADRSQLDLSMVRSACYVHVGPLAVRHALRVASGLDSVVLGEDQIQGQFKRAIDAARNAATIGAAMDRLGSAAIACGKRVRTFTGIGHHSVSLELLAVRAAAERLAGLRSKRALVLGAGESASLVVRHLRSAGAQITVMSRTLTHARALATSVDAEARRLAELPEALVDVEVVFACASAPEPVLTPATIERRLSRTGERRMLCVDLGMPRGIDCALESIGGVTVVRLDQLAAMAEAHWSARRQHIPAAESIVNGESDRFLEWWNARGVSAVIATLNAHADAVAEHELARAMPRLRSLTPQQREVVTKLAHRIVRKLMHRPMNALKHNPEADNMARVLECLFGASGSVDRLQQQLPSPADARVEQSVS